MRSNKEIIEDAGYLLRGWPKELKAEVWESLKLAIDSHKELHGQRRIDTAQWITVLKGSKPFDGLLVRIAAIAKELTGRPIKEPLARLAAVLALLAVERGDKKLIGKLDGHIEFVARQIKIRLGSDGNDRLTNLLRGYLRIDPDISTRAVMRQILEYWHSTRPEWIDYDGEELCFQARKGANFDLLTIAALSKRMNKLRPRLGLKSITGRRNRLKAPGEAKVSPKAKEPHSYPKWFALEALA
jgi:hypothetical protein